MSKKTNQTTGMALSPARRQRLLAAHTTVATMLQEPPTSEFTMAWNSLTPFQRQRLQVAQAAFAAAAQELSDAGANVIAVTAYFGTPDVPLSATFQTYAYTTNRPAHTSEDHLFLDVLGDIQEEWSERAHGPRPAK